MKIGDRVVIVRDTYGDRNGYEKIGLSGQIVRYAGCGDGSILCWDVKLDEPLRDRREYLWFGERELQVL